MPMPFNFTATPPEDATPDQIQQGYALGKKLQNDAHNTDKISSPWQVARGWADALTGQNKMQQTGAAQMAAGAEKANERVPDTAPNQPQGAPGGGMLGTVPPPTSLLPNAPPPSPMSPVGGATGGPMQGAMQPTPGMPLPQPRPPMQQMAGMPGMPPGMPPRMPGMGMG